MRVADVMQTDLRVIRGTDTVISAIGLLADNHVSGLPVVDEHGRLVGVLSSSDILETLAEHSDPEAREAVFEETLIQEIMTPRPQTITPEAELKDAAQRMVYLEVHRLFVEHDGRLVGVVSTTDLVRALAGVKT
jgi:CBS domain-containing protein